MAEAKPLRLKREIVSGKKIPASNLPIARVLVDTGLTHLDQPYDYLISENDANLNVGALVEVPFGGKSLEGYVLERVSVSSESGKLKYISKIISNLELCGGETFELVREVAARYGAAPWDLLPSAIPHRVAKVEKNFLNSTSSPDSVKQRVSAPKFLQKIDRYSLRGLVEKSYSDSTFTGQLLVVVPDERDLARLRLDLRDYEPIELGSHLSPSERYQNFLGIRFNSPKLIIGTRSAVFTPLVQGSRIIVVDDGDESAYDRRYPYWNVRDVALLRSKRHSLIFLSSSPSLEVLKYSNLGWFAKSKYVNLLKNRNIRTSFLGPRKSELDIIREGLRVGNVLVSISEPGYVNSFSCQKCRNIAICNCGGRLRLLEQGSQVSCSICDLKISDWKCTWCNSDSIRIVSKGGNRVAQELAKSFPGVRIVVSRGGSRVDQIPEGSGNILAIATYGCEPFGEYSAYVALGLDSLLNRIEMRASENARRLIFNNVILVNQGGDIYLDLEPTHPFSQGILKFNPFELAQQELTERATANLPPMVRSALISGEGKDLRRIESLLEGLEFEVSSNIVGTLNKDHAGDLFLRTSADNSANFSKFLYSLNRYRSIKGISGLKIQVDPYGI